MKNFRIRLVGVFLILGVIFGNVPVYGAFWDKFTNKQPGNQQSQSQSQSQNNSQNQSKSELNNKSSDDNNSAIYPNDVDTNPIAQEEYLGEDIDVEEQYRKMPVPDFKYVHDIDPEEYQDTMYSTWSPYPLFRLTAPLYFKTTVINSGYYLLTPREHEGKWYILFKEAGRVKYIVPCYKREMVPMNFYKNNLPQIKLTRPQKIREIALKWVGEHFDSSKRKPIPDTFLDATDLDNSFISIIVYWGNYRYYFVLRSVQL